MYNFWKNPFMFVLVLLVLVTYQALQLHSLLSKTLHYFRFKDDIEAQPEGTFISNGIEFVNFLHDFSRDF